MNILAQYGAPSGISGPLGIHREIEALKHAFAVRMNLGDPDFINVTEVVSDMLSPKFADTLKKTIYDNMTFDPRYYGGRYATSLIRVWAIYMIITVSTYVFMAVAISIWKNKIKVDVHMLMC